MFWHRWALKSRYKQWMAPLFRIQGSIHSVGQLDLWSQAFGSPSHPAILLLMGGGCQGILWTDSFCQSLALEGFFVIRFDHRDTGLSSYTNQPYTLLDLGDDALGLLTALGCTKAHLVGTSMGGMIAQLLAAHHPERVETITLLSTTKDLEGVLCALQGMKKKTRLSLPTSACFDWMDSLQRLPPRALFKKIRKHFQGWKILNGPDAFFDRVFYGRLFCQSLLRQRSYEAPLRHVQALAASCELLQRAQEKIRVPTLVIHGEKDPLFPKDHAEALAGSIQGSKLCLIESMGHNLTPCFYPLILQRIVSFLKEH